MPQNPFPSVNFWGRPDGFGAELLPLRFTDEILEPIAVGHTGVGRWGASLICATSFRDRTPSPNLLLIAMNVDSTLLRL